MMQTRHVHEIHMACASEEAAEKVAQYDPHLAGDTIHIVSPDGNRAAIQFEDPAWPISVAESARNDGHVTSEEAARVISLVRNHLPVPAQVPTSTWAEKERMYLALLDLAPQFDIPCRPGGALRDITVSKHRNGPKSPWQWAIHRYGAGLTTYAWDGKTWTIVDRPVHLLNHAVWNDPIQALSEAQRIAQADENRGYTELDTFRD